MQEAVTEAVHDPLMTELRAQGAVMVRVATFICTLAFLLLWPVDPYLAQGWDLWAARLVRSWTCFGLMALFVASFVRDWGNRYSRAMTLSAAVLTFGAVIVLAYLTGGGDSDYHEALYVAIFGYATLPAAWRRYDAPVLFLAMLLTYDLVLFVGGRLGSFAAFLTHNTLLAASVVAAVALRQIIMDVRRRDIAQREELGRANEQLKAVDEAKSRFFANVSHELRTPLTLTLAPLEAMIESLRDPLTPGQREKLDLAHRNALRLLRQVDDLLSLTRAEAASLQLRVSPVDVRAMLSGLSADISELAARKRILLTLEVAADLRPIEADGELLERVLLNVIGNAAKFVKEGGNIRLSAHPENHGVRIDVEDDGIGIAPEDLPHIFTRFYQVDTGSTRHFGGTGIGLALSREIVELHGGTIQARSERGRGTTVSAWLPAVLAPDRASLALRTAPDESRDGGGGLPEWHDAIRTARGYRFQGIEDATERRVAPRPRPKGRAPTLLVVEDNPDMIRFLVALLANDFNVLSAQDGAMGLKMAVERQPDLIISDVMMPEMDGLEMARRLRATPGTRQIPLIFLTARGSPEDRRVGHEGGAETYLPKPFRGEELLAAVDALLSRQRIIRDAAASRQDEAIVYMASGVREAVEAVEVSLRDLSAAVDHLPVEVQTRTRHGVAGLHSLSAALTHLSLAGTHTVEKPAMVGPAIREALLHNGPRGQDVSVIGPAEVWVQLRHEELVDVVGVLVDRALRATAEDRMVTVTTLDGPDQITITVADEGPSLTMDQIDRLFFPFHEMLPQGAGPLEGVAMAYAFRVVRARRGALSIETEGGLGTAIVLTLPKAAGGDGRAG